MSFEEILPHLRSGKYVWRKSWYTSWCKLQQHMWYEIPEYPGASPILRFLFSGNLRAEDLEAQDWEIFERSEKNPKPQ